MRIEIFYQKPGMDGRAKKLLKSLRHHLSDTLIAAETLDVYLIEGVTSLTQPLVGKVFCDPVIQHYSVDGLGPEKAPLKEWEVLIEVSYKAGVTNPMAQTARQALENALGEPLDPLAIIQTATQYLFQFSQKATRQLIEALSTSLHNKLIQQAVVLTHQDRSLGKSLPPIYPHSLDNAIPETQTIPLTQLTPSELEALSKNRLLALTLSEMQAIQGHYANSETQATRQSLGLPMEPTDVELEMLAQTWSEHCKHKIFQADINYTDAVNGETLKVNSLYNTFIKQTTRDLWDKKPFLKSVFSDNAGVVQFDDDTLLCFKVETHNSPSALDPFGGAITGIVGVNRDILGTGKGAKPIFNTNYLCFGAPDTDPNSIPKGLLHPLKVLEGVHHGIIEGGNHSGIPVVSGGFLFDESYVGKPLVFCGTGGILPAKLQEEESHLKHIDSGDLVVMLGGRIGKDGIHGATFSSLALDEESPTSAVQIGDPITQRKMTDFLIMARDQGLYKGITDNGAGGLSSSLGEMAESSGGVVIDLDQCPLKYQGLAPWEILVSESQERMSLAVDPDYWTQLRLLALKMDVEATIVGQFTDEGAVIARFNGKNVCHLPLEFLHKGLPTLQLQATWTPPIRKSSITEWPRDFGPLLLEVLSDPTVSSKENLVRQYDHEVQGRSIIKPFVGPKADGPSDGAVLKIRPNSNKGITVTHGVCPRYGDLDARSMAMSAVDEAFRAHIALGGDPFEASVLDNFCWPDPVLSEKTPDGPYKLAQLVRACQGLREACLAYQLPLISGKDSMKNDANMNGKKVSIRPTLLISLMGAVADVNQAMGSDFLHPGDLIYVLGVTGRHMGGTILEKVSKTTLEGVPTPQLETAFASYQALHQAIVQGLVSSVHDLSDGGLAAALAESCLGGRLGAKIKLDTLGTAQSLLPVEVLFSETPSRFLISVPRKQATALESLLKPFNFSRIGEVTSSPKLVIKDRGRKLIQLKMEALLGAWNSLNEAL